MFELNVFHQSNYSRAQLLIRTFLGLFYIIIPHLFVLFFFLIWSKLLWIYSVFHVLLTGKLPESVHAFQLGFLRWATRLHCSVYNLVDEYPAFGINGVSESVKLKIAFDEAPNRLTTLLRFILAPVVVFPHLLVWSFRNLVSLILTFLAFWVVLFTGKYPITWYEFNVGTLRWIIRVYAYMYLLIDNYPPFSGSKIE